MADTIEDLIRRIIREELTAFFGSAGSTRVQAARNSVTESRPTTGGWFPCDSFDLKSGDRTYTVRVNDPCKVRGFGKRIRNPQTGELGEPSTADGYHVVSIQQRGSDINVEVRRGRGGQAKTVKSDRIVYKRPKRGA